MVNQLSYSVSSDLLLIILVILILLSAFFSASETSMMALNRYKLKHLAKNNNNAKRTSKLLLRPDRLLGVILIGNTCANIASTAIVSVLGIRWMGEQGVLIATLILTLAILLFAEIAPKTLAVTKPESIAYPASLPLQWLTWILFPLVFLSNFVSNGLLWIIGARNKNNSESLTLEELRTILNEASSMIPSRHKEMLSSILDLEKITVDDIMIPRVDVLGIDLDDTESDILSQIENTHHTMLPVFRSDLDKIIGFVHMRDIAKYSINNNISIQQLSKLIKKPYFIPEGTPLHTQLINFQHNKVSIGLIVDEYGDVLGIITLKDILEEIVGEFTTNLDTSNKEVISQKDGSFLVNGNASIRALNRTMNWDLPIDGAKTLSGAIIEYLEYIPKPATCVKLNSYSIEIISVQDNIIKTAKVFV